MQIDDWFSGLFKSQRRCLFTGVFFSGNVTPLLIVVVIFHSIFFFLLICIFICIHSHPVRVLQILVDVLSSAAINKKFQVHLRLTEETSSVDELQMMLKERLGLDIILLDAKHLPVMSRETTKGKTS